VTGAFQGIENATRHRLGEEIDVLRETREWLSFLDHRVRTTLVEIYDSLVRQQLN